MKDKDIVFSGPLDTKVTGAFTRWELPLPVEGKQVGRLSEELGVSEEISSLILRRTRGLIAPARNLWTGQSPLPEVMALPGIEEAVTRIGRAVESQEHVLVYSDFDADGVTSAVILKEALEQTGLRHISVFFPCRFKDGYGFHPELVEGFGQQGISLIITADCGITGEDGCARARNWGIDVVITDHHKIGPQLPRAFSIINPQLPSWQRFELQDLTGAGVAYLLARGLLEERSLLGEMMPNWAQDMLALSIAGDGQPVTGLNRVWIKEGLRLLAETHRPGIIALLLVSGIFRFRRNEYSDYASTASAALGHIMAGNFEEAAIQAMPGEIPDIHKLRENLELRDIEFERDVMFGLVPRINAAGRMSRSMDAFNLLCETDFQKALKLAVQLDDLNQKRRHIEEKMLEECFLEIESSYCPKSLPGDDLDPDLDLGVTGSSGTQEPCLSYPRYSVFAYRPLWHQGVIGIAASRIRDAYGRPCALAGGEGPVLKGSVRGIPGFNVHKALSRCQEYLIGFGGHEGAGGFSVSEGNIPLFSEKFEKVCKELLEHVPVEPVLKLDEIFNAHDLQEEFLRSCMLLEPFGAENPAPVFGVFGCKIMGARLLGKARNHLELLSEGKEPLRFIWFGSGDKAVEVCFPGACDIAFTPRKNTYMGKESISLLVKDIRPAWSLFGHGYRKLACSVQGKGPSIVYTWSKDAASSMYIALLRQGIRTGLHFSGQKEALVHDAGIILNQENGVVVSTSPWDLLSGYSGPGINVIIVHPPVSTVSWNNLLCMAGLPGVNLIFMDKYIEDGEIWFESRFPSKEYMEKMWTSLNHRSFNNQVAIWKAGPMYLHFQDSENKTYEQKLLLISSCISIMMELGMISYDIIGKTPQFVLHRPKGQVSLLKSTLYSLGRQAGETARCAWQMYEGGTRYGG